MRFAFGNYRFRTDWREKRLKTGRASDRDGSDPNKKEFSTEFGLIYLRNLGLQMTKLTLGISRIIKGRGLGGYYPHVEVAGIYLV